MVFILSAEWLTRARIVSGRRTWWEPQPCRHGPAFRGVCRPQTVGPISLDGLQGAAEHAANLADTVAHTTPRINGIDRVEDLPQLGHAAARELRDQIVERREQQRGAEFASKDRRCDGRACSWRTDEKKLATQRTSMHLDRDGREVPIVAIDVCLDQILILSEPAPSVTR